MGVKGIWKKRNNVYFTLDKELYKKFKKKVTEQGYTVTGALERIFEKVINDEIVFEIRDKFRDEKK